jgi:phosphatidate cytidylyltransferase
MLTKRILTVVLGAPIVIGTILCPRPAVFQSFVALCLLLALWEFFSVVSLPKTERIVAVALGLLHVLYILYCPAERRRELVEVTLLLISLFLFYCFLPMPTLQGVAQRIGLSILGILYIGTFGAAVGLLRELPHGIFWVLVLLASTWLNDTFAYFFGHWFGRRRLAPMISPGKTIEGLMGGFLGSFVGFLVFWCLLENPLSLGQGVFLVLLVGIAGPLGDLSESLIKRSFGVKDSGNIIPGHGGMLDRIDALLFTAPVVYFYAKYLL